MAGRVDNEAQTGHPPKTHKQLSVIHEHGRLTHQPTSAPAYQPQSVSGYRPTRLPYQPAQQPVSLLAYWYPRLAHQRTSLLARQPFNSSAFRFTSLLAYLPAHQFNSLQPTCPTTLFAVTDDISFLKHNVCFHINPFNLHSMTAF